MNSGKQKFLDKISFHPPRGLCCDFAEDLKKICFYGCVDLFFILGFFSYINKIYMTLKCNIWGKLLQSCMSFGDRSTGVRLELHLHFRLWP